MRRYGGNRGKKQEKIFFVLEKNSGKKDPGEFSILGKQNMILRVSRTPKNGDLKFKF
ncbi:hypothetical protein CAEBREN_23449 [Caenorhabditis brenneri]|uniref:Uncharacterized protein n=1 Tax=Caenorhabditis brenneri TaxID=135651 RepID=G0N847_CAEBE|nr:hypothetical protein CAEBREN_23449 [Caenorhabditis brenneri]